MRCQLPLHGLERGRLALAGLAPRGPEVQHHHLAVEVGQGPAAVAAQQRQVDVASGRRRPLALLDLGVQPVVLAALDDAVDQQPDEGGRQDADDDGDARALHQCKGSRAGILRSRMRR